MAGKSLPSALLKRLAKRGLVERSGKKGKKQIFIS